MSITAKITSIAEWIESRLSDGSYDRQVIAEYAALLLRDLAKAAPDMRAGGMMPATVSYVHGGSYLRVPVTSGQTVTLTPAQTEVLAQALADAVEWRTPVCGGCPDCEAADEHRGYDSPAVCDDHASDAALTGQYTELFRTLSGEARS